MPARSDPPAGRVAPWVEELVDSGEAMAMLSLAGNHAATLPPSAVGGVVHYSPRGLEGGKLGPAFAYEVEAVFGRGEEGRAVAFRPRHAADDLMVAFRGVRVSLPHRREEGHAEEGHAEEGVRAAGGEAEELPAAHLQDVAALLDLCDSTVCWGGGDQTCGETYRVHHGILRHHEAIWGRPKPAPPACGLGGGSGVAQLDNGRELQQQSRTGRAEDFTDVRLEEGAEGWGGDSMRSEAPTALGGDSSRRSVEEAESSRRSAEETEAEAGGGCGCGAAVGVAAVGVAAGAAAAATAAAEGDESRPCGGAEGEGEEGEAGLEELGAWLERLEAGRPRRLLFFGLSLGASLAQLSALRLASEPATSRLASSVHVLAIGAARWGDERVAERFAAFLGRRSVSLVNSMAVPPPLPRGAFWWVPSSRLGLPAAAGVGGAGGGGVGGASLPVRPEAARRGFVVVDPLTAGYSPTHALLPHVVLCHQTDPPVGRSRCGAASLLPLGPRSIDVLTDMRAQPGALAALMQGALPAQHPMSLAYMALHLGRRYRLAFLALYLSRRGSPPQRQPLHDAGSPAPLSLKRAAPEHCGAVGGGGEERSGGGKSARPSLGSSLGKPLQPLGKPLGDKAESYGSLCELTSLFRVDSGQNLAGLLS